MDDATDMEQIAVDVVIPALNEAEAINGALRDVPRWVRRIVVADNGSTDATVEIARACGATVVHAPRRGYGAACLAALSYIASDPPDVVVFMDADGSDVPDEMNALVAPIRTGVADLVIGSRVLGSAEPGSLTMPQRFGNALATTLIRVLWSRGARPVPCTDLGPFRAIRWSTLRALAMDDLDYGWTVQMQARAAKGRFPILEVPVSYRRRVGRSKISGTVRGVVGAGTKILGTIGVEALRGRPKRVRTIVMSRVPVPGQTKTRMIPALGPDGAAALHEAMTRHTVAAVREWLRRSHRREWIADAEVRTTGGESAQWAARFGWSLCMDGACRDQGSGNLGERLKRAVDQAFASGVDAVIAIGCDCPELDAKTLTDAAERLRAHDAVIVPAEDGGYCLIGLARAVPTLFDGVDWGSERVFEQTMARAHQARLSVTTLPTMSDVDLPEDLPRWERVRDVSTNIVPRVSVVIPALDEAERLSATIANVRQADDIEIIVVDGGSDDGTPEIAESLGAIVIRHEPGTLRGRAIQMNRGAAIATSDLLLFLHADTQLPFGWLDEIEPLRDARYPSAVAFRLGFDRLTPSLRLIQRVANWRSAWLRRPYGDQGLAMTRETFERVGRFPKVPVMEDVAIVAAVRRTGSIRISRRSAITSSRRWLANGVWRTTIRHQMALLGAALGVAPTCLARVLGRAEVVRPSDRKLSVTSDSPRRR